MNSYDTTGISDALRRRKFKPRRTDGIWQQLCSNTVWRPQSYRVDIGPGPIAARPWHCESPGGWRRVWHVSKWWWRCHWDQWRSAETAAACSAGKCLPDMTTVPQVKHPTLTLHLPLYTPWPIQHMCIEPDNVRHTSMDHWFRSYK